MQPVKRLPSLLISKVNYVDIFLPVDRIPGLTPSQDTVLLLGSSGWPEASGPSSSGGVNLPPIEGTLENMREEGGECQMPKVAPGSLLRILQSAFLNEPLTTPPLYEPERAVLRRGFQTCVIPTAYLAAPRCLKWGARNVRHVSPRSRAFILFYFFKYPCPTDGNVNLPARFLKVNKYEGFPVREAH